jgi:hypothetical protein
MQAEAAQTSPNPPSTTRSTKWLPRPLPLFSITTSGDKDKLLEEHFELTLLYILGLTTATDLLKACFEISANKTEWQSPLEALASCLWLTQESDNCRILTS